MALVAYIEASRQETSRKSIAKVLNLMALIYNRLQRLPNASMVRVFSLVNDRLN